MPDIAIGTIFQGYLSANDNIDKEIVCHSYLDEKDIIINFGDKLITVCLEKTEKGNNTVSFKNNVITISCNFLSFRQVIQIYKETMDSFVMNKIIVQNNFTKLISLEQAISKRKNKLFEENISTDDNDNNYSFAISETSIELKHVFKNFNQAFQIENISKVKKRSNPAIFALLLSDTVDTVHVELVDDYTVDDHCFYKENTTNKPCKTVFIHLSTSSYRELYMNSNIELTNFILNKIHSNFIEGIYHLSGG